MIHDDVTTEQSWSQSFDAIPFHELIDVIDEAMLLVDSSGHVLHANIAATRLFGYAHEELCGMEVEKLMPERFSEKHRLFRQMYVADPRKRPMGNAAELVLLNRHHEEVAVKISLSPITANNQVYVLATFIAQDRRRQAELALYRNEESLRLIKQAAGAGLFDIDCVNNTVYCDSRMQELWGYEAHEIITLEKFFAAIHPSDRIQCRKLFDEAVKPEKGGNCRAEFRVVQSSESSERWIATLGQVQFKNGAAQRFVGIARDITEKKLLEQKVRQQRNETEMLFKQHIALLTAAAIAHELNSPLAAITAYSEVAQRALNVSPVDCDKAKEALDGCFNQARRAGQKIHELIELLRANEVEAEVFDLNSLVKDALSQSRSDGYSDFYFELDFETKLPDVKANRSQIQMVIVNLIRNAVEAMRMANIAGSKILISLRTEADKNMAIVTIQDDGPGIDRDTICRIFQPFFTTKSTGLGMGLSISRALVEANDGQLWIDPDFQQGAQFHFTLPFAS